ncbi:MAG TPA: RNA polymerase sigma factor [Actinomycetota bacterium]
MRGAPPPPFERFFEAHRGTVLRLLTVAVGPQEADDVAQETFLAALRAYPRVRDDGRLDRWILTIASNKAIDHHRGSGRRAAPVEVVPEGREGAVAPPADPDEELWGAVRALPPKQRVAVVLRHVLDRPYEEIAAITGVSQEAARANVSAAVRKLRERIG